MENTRIKKILINCRNELLKNGMFSEKQLEIIENEKIMKKLKPYIDQNTEDFAVELIELICSRRLNLKEDGSFWISFEREPITSYFHNDFSLIANLYKEALQIISENPEWNAEKSLSQDQFFALAYYLDSDKYDFVTFIEEKYYLIDYNMFLDMIKPIISPPFYQEGYGNSAIAHLDDYLLHMEDDNDLDNNKDLNKVKSLFRRIKL